MLISICTVCINPYCTQNGKNLVEFCPFSEIGLNKGTFFLKKKKWVLKYNNKGRNHYTFLKCNFTWH